MGPVMQGRSHGASHAGPVTQGWSHGASHAGCICLEGPDTTRKLKQRPLSQLLVIIYCLHRPLRPSVPHNRTRASWFPSGWSHPSPGSSGPWNQGPRQMEPVTRTLTVQPRIALTKARRLPEGQRRPLALSLVTLLPGQHRAHLSFVPSTVTRTSGQLTGRGSQASQGISELGLSGLTKGRLEGTALEPARRGAAGSHAAVPPRRWLVPAPHS